jgi:hypothetical protein
MRKLNTRERAETSRLLLKRPSGPSTNTVLRQERGHCVEMWTSVLSIKDANDDSEKPGQGIFSG